MRWLFNFIALATLVVSLVCMGDMVGRYYGTPYLQKTVEMAGTATDAAVRYGISGRETMRNALDELTKRFEKFTETDEKSHRITTGEES